MTPQALLAPARLARGPILASQSDERLVDLVRAGYEPAFEAIVGRYRAPLVGYCRRFLPEARAEDAVQQAFVNAYAAMKDGEGELRLRAWLYRIVHNVALNALRDRGLQYEQLHDQLDGVERPDQALERRQDLRETLSAVQALPARQRDAIVLRELEGRSYEEIALELGVTGGAVRQLLNRARTKLRAGATALTPTGLVMRVPWSDSGDSLSARIAELCGTSAGVVAAKVCATALVTGAVIGGVTALPELPASGHDASAAQPSQAAGAGDQADRLRAAELRRAAAAGEAALAEGSSSDRSGSGPSAGESESGDDSSGTSGGSDSSGPSDSSGSGSGDSGSGTSGSDSSGSGSTGSGSSGSDSSGPGPGGTDTSGSGTSGSGTSGSGTSGSGTSGSSGSGELTTTLDGQSGSGSSGSPDSGSGSLSSDSSDGH